MEGSANERRRAVGTGAGKGAVEREARWNDLPDELWLQVLKDLPQRDAFPFASTCKQFRRVQVASNTKLVTSKWDILPPLNKTGKVSESWCLWHSLTLQESDEEAAKVILQVAASYGYLDVLMLWRARNQSEDLWTWHVCEWAACGGQLGALKWLRSQNPPCSIQEALCCSDAARRGHVEVLRWLRSEGSQWNKQRCRRNAELRGHTQVVRWIDGQSGD